jgi:hypothetical protein
MTCKDCVHYGLCNFDVHIIYNETKMKLIQLHEANDVEKKCDAFKNKADVVPVVRCKDCKYYDVYRLECHNPHHHGIINCEGYCSYGERRCE